MNRFSGIALLLCVLSLGGAFAAGESEGSPVLNPPQHPTVRRAVSGPTLNLTSDDTEAVDSLIDYNVSLLLSEEYFKILDDHQDLVWIQAHLGAGTEIRFDDRPNHYGATVGLRLNLLRPKIPGSRMQLARIYKLYALANYYEVGLATEDLQRIESIRQELETYESERWFKRIAIGVGVPYVVSAAGEDRFSDEVTEYMGNGFLFGRGHWFVAYDPTDYISLYAGAHYFMESVFLGVTFDVSTPVRTAYRGIGGWIRRFAGLY